MYWEEKIDRLRTKYTPDEFRDVFSDWPMVLRKIEASFIKKQDSSYHFTNWANNLKLKVPIGVRHRHAIATEISKLTRNFNYWAVIVMDDSPTAKHLVYDCQPNSLLELLAIAPGDFYIIDKRYQWLAFFSVDKVKDEVAFFRGSGLQTPFD